MIESLYWSATLQPHRSRQLVEHGSTGLLSGAPPRRARNARGAIGLVRTRRCNLRRRPGKCRQALIRPGLRGEGRTRIRASLLHPQSKVAVAERAAPMVRVQVGLKPAPAQTPPQPAKVEPPSAVAVNVTEVLDT